MISMPTPPFPDPPDDAAVTEEGADPLVEACAHEDLQPGECDISQPGEMWESWYCPDCEAYVAIVYQPALQIIESTDLDAEVQYRKVTPITEDAG